MINLWQQICEIADFDKNNEVDTEEFMKGVETACKGKSYEDLPEAFKFFIEAQFRTIDVDGKIREHSGKIISNFPLKATVLSVSRSFATTVLAVWLTPTSTFWMKHLIKLLRARVSPWPGTRTSTLSSWATLTRPAWPAVCSVLCPLFKDPQHHPHTGSKYFLALNNFLL